MAAAGLAQRLQRGEPADVTLAPPRHAVAQPVLLGDDLAVELVLIAFLLGQHLVTPALEIGKAAFVGRLLGTAAKMVAASIMVVMTLFALVF